MQKYQKDFVELAVHAGALKFGSFTLKSGRVSPYFFSSGVFFTGEFTRALALLFAEHISHSIKAEKYDAIFGPAYKGIPLAVSVSMALAGKGINKPWCFNRKEEKTHGDCGAFVGAPIEGGKRLIIIDDVFTTGGAKEEAILQLSSVAKITLAGVFILLDRQEKDAEGRNAIAQFEKKHRTKVYPIVTADDIFAYLSKENPTGMKLEEKTIGQYEKYKKEYGV